MTAGKGYYRLYRGWLDHDLFRGQAYCERAAWAWLIEHAAFAKKRGGVGRGELVVSIRQLALAWKWNPGKVRSFLGRLSRSTQISTQTSTKGRAAATHITICNYEKFQIPLPTKEVPGNTRASTRHRDSNKEGNNKKGKIVDVCIADAIPTPRRPTPANFNPANPFATFSASDVAPVGSTATAAPTVSWGKVLFGDALTRLADCESVDEERLRPLLAKWNRTIGNDPALLVELIDYGISRSPKGGAIGYITAAVNNRGREKQQPKLHVL